MAEQSIERANILIVEDERIIGKDIELRLKKLGYRVTGVVSTGKKALETIEASTSPDLILMDVKLKGKMDGIETAEIIRNRFDIPVIYMTAYSDHVTLERAKVTEPFGYILKPFNEKELHSTIEMALYKHKTERKLRENKEWLSTTLRSIGDGIITTDIMGNITSMNPVAEALTGMKQESVLGKQFTETCFVVEEGLQRLPENMLKQVLAGEGEPGLVSRAMLIVKNGRKIPVENTVAPIRNALGNITGAVLVFRNVTEQKIAEEALRESEERFRLTFDQSPMGMAIVSLNHRFLRVNAKLCLMTGYTEEELKGLMFSDITHPDDCEASIHMAESMASGKIDQFQMDKRYIRKDNSFLWVHVTIGIVKDMRSGRPLYSLGAMEDIQERKQLEDQLKHSQEMKVLGQLAAGVAHEVRNPLNAILAITEALFQDIGNNEAYQPYLGHIRTQVTRLSELMKDLLELGKPIRHSDLRKESLTGICRSAINLWEQTTRIKNAMINFNAQAEPPEAYVVADNSRLQQAFLNLLENAVQHSRNGDEVAFSVCFAEDNIARVLIADSGAGVEIDKLEKVFEPFYTTRKGGVGLGLSIVKHSIESMGGTVKIRNNDPLPGCTVEVALPYMQGAGI